MLDINVINEEIEKLEQSNTCYRVCEKLAMLYIVRDHMKENDGNGFYETEVVNTGMEIMPSVRSVSSNKVMTASNGGETAMWMNKPQTSEFIQYASSLSYDELMTLFDLHMETMKVMMPSEYQKIMECVKHPNTVKY